MIRVMYPKDHSESAGENVLNWAGKWHAKGLHKVSDNEIPRMTLIWETLRKQNKKELKEREETGTTSKFLILSTGKEILIQKL